MTMRRVAWAVVVVLLGNAGVVRAQGFMGWFEGGKQNSAFANGLNTSGVAAGGGFQLTIGGAASKKTGVIVPVGMELKFSQGSDLMGTVDIGIRAGSISFGPGAAFGLMTRSYVDDPRCV